MDKPGNVIRSANTLLVYMAGLLELISICQGRSIHDSNQTRSFNGDKTKLATTLGLQGTTPYLSVVKSPNRTLGTTSNTGRDSQNVDSDAGSIDTLGSVLTDPKVSIDPASDSVNGSVSNPSYASPWSVPNTSEEKEFPLPLLVASPAVAVSIVVFICVAYKWHSFQLDEQARKLAMKVSDSLCAPSICSPSVSCVPCSPCRTATTTTKSKKPPRASNRGSRPGDRSKRPLLPPGRAYPDDQIPSGSRDPRRLSSGAFAAAATSLPSLAGGKRGSCLSTLSADQEVLNSASPRRHSTFVL